MGADEEIFLALGPVVQAAGLEIWDIERSGANIRVMVEREGGVDLDAIAQVSSAISAALDQRDDLVPAGRYVLEVSSPGLERRLRKPSHFAGYVGQEVSLKVAPAAGLQRRLRGLLVAAEEGAVVIRCEVAPGGAQDVRVPLDMVERANVVFTWGAQPAPRSAKPSGKPARERPSRRQALAEVSGEPL